MIPFLALLAVAFVFLALAIWRSPKTANLLGSVIAASLVSVGISLVVYGLFFAEATVVRQRHAIERLLEPAVVPIFVLLPAGVAFCLAQWLRRRDHSVRFTRGAASVAGLAAFCVAPFGAIAAGCGLAGQCF